MNDEGGGINVIGIVNKTIRRESKKEEKYQNGNDIKLRI